MGYQSNWTAASFSGAGIIILLAYIDLIIFGIRKANDRLGYERVDHKEPWFKWFVLWAFYFVGMLLILASFYDLIKETDSTYIEAMNDSWQTASIILSLVGIIIGGSLAGGVYAWYVHDRKRYCTFVTCVTIGVVLFLTGWGILLYLLVEATSGTFYTYAFIGVLAPVGEILLFPFRFEVGTKEILISIIPRIMIPIGYIFFTMSLNNMI